MPDDTIEGEAPAAPVVDPVDHAAVQLENVLLRAGVELDTPHGQALKDAYEGRTVPDLETVKARWEILKPTPQPDAPAPEAERIEGEDGQAEERRLLTASSVVEPNPENDDPRALAVKAGFDTLTPPQGVKAGTRDDALASAFHVLAEAAERGDTRVLVQAPAPS